MSFQITLFQFLLLSAAPLFTQAKVEFFQGESFQGSLYSAERTTTSCETLPRSQQNKANSIKTDTCILIYSDEFCVGSFFKVESGEHSSLPYFKNQVESYRACTDVSKDEPWRDVRIKFYLHDGSNEMLWDTPITPECVTLPSDFMRKASAVNPDLCVNLFSDPKCVGGQYKVESTGYDKDLADFNDATKSFMPCNISDIYKTTFRPNADAEGRQSNKSVTTQVNNSIKSRAEFFRYEQFGGNLHIDGMVTTTCENLSPYMWGEAGSIRTEGCIILYTAGFCKGSYFRVEAGDHAELPHFSNKAVSYRACSDVRKNQKIEPLSPDGPRIQLFDYYNDSIWDDRINPNCTTLPETIRNRTSSLKSDICVILFSDTNCVGSQFLVQDFLWDNSLEYFQDKLVSFMPCNAGDVLNKSVVLTTTTKTPILVTFPTTTIKPNVIIKPYGLPISHEIKNLTSENSMKTQHHSENSLMLLAAILCFVVVLVLFQVWMCFLYRVKLLIILKRAWHGINTKADDEMIRFQTL